MVRRLHFPTATLALLALSVPPGLGAQTAAPPAADPAAKRNRAISGDVAAMLAATAPKYTPPPPAPPPPTAAELAKKAEEEAADLRDTDKPKNTIVRLPSYIVQEQRPAIFSERDINTKKGLRELAMRRYFTDAGRAMNRFTLPLFAPWSPGSGQGSASEERALFMYSEDERLRNMSDLADNTNMVMKSNASDGAGVKREAQKTFMRTDDFGWRNGNKK